MGDVFNILESNNILKVGAYGDGIDGHFRTQKFQVVQRNRYDSQGNHVYSGWAVTNQIKIDLENTEKLSSLLSLLLKVKDSSNLNIHGIEYGIKNSENAVNQARKAAVVNATKKARLYTEAVGATLGKVKSITETGVSVPNSRNEGIQVFAADAGRAPVTGGDPAISVTVRVSFSIEE